MDETAKRPDGPESGAKQPVEQRTSVMDRFRGKAGEARGRIESLLSATKRLDPRTVRQIESLAGEHEELTADTRDQLISTAGEKSLGGNARGWLEKARSLHRERAARKTTRQDHDRSDQLLDRGTIRLDDERDASAYLSTIGRDGRITSEQISDALRRGISIERIADDSRLAGLITDGFVRQLDAQIAVSSGEVVDQASGEEDPGRPTLVYGFPYSDNSEILRKILEKPEYRDKVVEAVDIQRYGDIALESTLTYFYGDDFMGEGNTTVRDEILRNAGMLKDLGFAPFSRDSSLQQLFDSYDTTRQENLFHSGLLERSTVDRMYAYQFDQLKQSVAQGRTRNMPLMSSLLEPSEDNQMANYWRSQSLDLGRDAMPLVISHLRDAVARHDIFGDQSQSGDGGRTDWVFFDRNGVPTDALFSNRSDLLVIAEDYIREGRAELGGDEVSEADAVLAYLSQNEPFYHTALHNDALRQMLPTARYFEDYLTRPEQSFVTFANAHADELRIYGHFTYTLDSDIPSFFNDQGPTDRFREQLGQAFEQSRQSFSEYEAAASLGLQSEKISQLGAAYSELLRRVPLFDFDQTDYVTAELLSPRVIDALGWDRLEQIIYYDSGASQKVASMSEQELRSVNEWLSYLDGLGIYGNNPQRLVALGILGYENCTELARELQGVELDDIAKKNLSYVLERENRHEVRTVDDLQNYRDFVTQKLQHDLDSDSVHSAKAGAFGILSLGSRLGYPPDTLSEWGQVEGYIDRLVDQGILDSTDVAVIDLVKAISSASTANEVRQMMNSFSIDTDQPLVGGAFDVVVEKIDRGIGEQFREAMFDMDTTGEGIVHSTIDGADGRTISTVLLRGAPFKLLNHTISYHDQVTIATQLAETPRAWNEAHGASTISTSLISNDYIKYANTANGSLSYDVCYGFSDYPSDAILGMGPGDIHTVHGIGSMEMVEDETTRFPFVSPDQLIQYSRKSGAPYNEVVLRRNAGNPDRYGGRLQPSCMIVYGNDTSTINEQTKRAAEYFNVPIVLIDAEAYGQTKLTPEAIDNVLLKDNYSPGALIDIFKREFREEFEADAGVNEGYTIEQHTAMVLSQFDHYFGDRSLPAGMTRDLMRVALALHDIGKPDAIRAGDKDRQHEFTEPIIRRTMRQLGYPERERELVIAMISGDPVGECMKAGRVKEEAVEEIKQKAQQVNVSVEQFLELLTIFYKSDAGSYSIDAGGQHSEVEKLFDFDRERHQLQLKDDYQRVIDDLQNAVLTS